MPRLTQIKEEVSEIKIDEKAMNYLLKIFMYLLLEMVILNVFHKDQ